MLISPSSPEFIHSLRYWGYPAMFLIMVLEGPIASMAGAFLASLGYFNVFMVFLLSVSGDFTGDIILYYMGYFGGRPLLLKVEKFLRIKESVVARMEDLFKRKGGKIIFYVKATTGLCFVTFVLAGTVRMKLSKFAKFSLLGGLVWSAFLVTVGWFFGYAADKISQYIKYAGVIIFIGVVIFFIGLTLYKRKQAKEIME